MMCLWASYKKKNIYINVAGSYLDVLFINKPSRWVFSRLLSSHAGGPGSIPDRDMSDLGPIVRDGDYLEKVSL
jgi:hypothetical protein